MPKWKQGVLATVFCVGAALAARADVVIAQISPQTGPLGGNGTANAVGARAYFEQVNAQGGVNGHRIRFVVEDDQYKADETVRLLQAVAQRDKPVMFVNLLGSANVSAVLKQQVLEKLSIPVVGVTPGSESLRNPGSPWMFHVQAGDKAQLARMLSHLATLNMRRLAVIYQDIPFGTSGLGFVEEIAAQLKLEVKAKVPVPPAADDLKPAVAKLQGTDVQANILILAPNSGIAFIRDARAAGNRIPIYSLSYVPVKGILEKVNAEQASGVAIAQVTPNAGGTSAGLTRDFHLAMDKHAPPGTDHSQLHLVGFIAARVAVEALRRAGSSPSPEKVASALKNLKMDLGGYPIDFGAGNNVGSQYVDIGAIDRSGRLRY